MSNKFLLTAFCKDRPGIVADISQVIFENGYNLEESSMMYLADEFAILLLLSAPPAEDETAVVEKLSSECRRLERDKNITAYIRSVSNENKPPIKDVIVKTIFIEGMDQAGIVYRVSTFLANSNLNIKTLSSEVTQSPESGVALYKMTILIEIPKRYSLKSLEEELAQIGDQLHVDVTLQ